jgi:hypothetical protein
MSQIPSNNKTHIERTKLYDFSTTTTINQQTVLLSLKDIKNILHDNINKGIILISIEEMHYIFMPSERV